MDKRLERIRLKKGTFKDFLSFLEDKAKEESPNADVLNMKLRRDGDNPLEWTKEDVGQISFPTDGDNGFSGVHNGSGDLPIGLQGRRKKKRKKYVKDFAGYTQTKSPFFSQHIETIFEYYKEIPKDNQDGDCYISAYNYFKKNYMSNNNIRLCHGLVTGQGKINGIVYNHAWCEDIETNMIYDMTMPKSFQEIGVDIYYLIGKISKVYKYDNENISEKIEEYQTYGPWEKELLENKY